MDDKRTAARRLSLCGLALAALCGGCPPLLAPGPDGTDTGARSASQIAARRIAPSRTENLPTATLTLSWTAVPNAASYSVFFGIDPNPPLLARVTNTSITVRDLPSCATHYWRVVAESDDASISSATWIFRTRCDD